MKQGIFLDLFLVDWRNPGLTGLGGKVGFFADRLCQILRDIRSSIA